MESEIIVKNWGTLYTTPSCIHMSKYSHICLPVVNLYRQADSSVEVVSQALYGWEILILEQLGEFARIQTQDHYAGWIESCGMSPSNSTLKGKIKKAKIIHNAAPIYASPHVNRSKPLCLLPFEVELDLLSEPEEEEGRWMQVELYEGGSGWIQRAQVCVDSKFLTLNQMLDLTGQFLGLPYIWGGTSSFGYDCSGFVQMLWRQMGIFLPRDANQQINDPLCYEVAWSDLRPGDLLFYGSSADCIRHVAIYLGNKMLVHASVKPVPIVQRSSLDEPSLQQRYAYRTARRLHVKEVCNNNLHDWGA